MPKNSYIIPNSPVEGKVYPHTNGIDRKHWEEWIQSGIDPEIISLNLKSVSGSEASECLLYSDALDRINTGRLSNYWMRRYSHLEDGGWWCNGVDILTGQESLWGCMKPDSPRIEDRDGKRRKIKYEHPPKVATEIFALRVSDRVWDKASSRYGVERSGNNFWQWVLATPTVPLIITEGAKKAAALLSAGFAAIALPGIYNAYRQPKDEEGNKTRPPHLIPQVEAFAKGTRDIVFAFDQDDKRRTRRNVNNAIAKTTKLLKKAGCSVRVASWNSKAGKGIDDVAVNLGYEQVETIINLAYIFDTWQIKRDSTLNYTPDLELNSRYLGNFATPDDAQLICLKAPKGTGKTEWLSRQLEEHLKEGKRVLVLTHRIQLGESLCKRFGVNWITDLRNDEGKLFGFGLCVDSLHPKSQAKFNPQDWKGAWMIIDEAEQVFWHLLDSSTCQRNRVSILRTLKDTIQTVLESKGKIFLSDADLSDLAIDYTRSYAGFDLKPWIAVNNYQPEGWKVVSHEETNPARLYASLEKAIAQGEKPFIAVSGQKSKSKWGTQNLERRLQEKFPDLKILRIDRESIADPNHSAYGCMSRLNEVLPHYDIVLASPTIETGVSIDCDHFTSVWGIFQGVQTTDSVRQALARVRSNVPRYIWVRKTGFNRVGNGATDIDSLLKGQREVFMVNVLKLVQADKEEIDSEFQQNSLNNWAKRAVIVNLGMKAYRETILEALKAEGHSIVLPEETEDNPLAVTKAEIEKTKLAVDNCKEEGYQAHLESVAAAESVDDNRYQELKDKRSRTRDELLMVEKGALERRYLIEINPDLVRKNDEGWHSQINLHYRWGEGREHLSAREAGVMRSMLDAGEGSLFLPDVNKKMMGAKIALLDWLEFGRLLEQREFSNNDEAVRDIANKVKSQRFAMRSILGVSVSDRESDMAIVQRLVGLIGFKFPYLRRVGSRRNRTRIYGAAAADFFTEEIDNDGKMKTVLVKNENGQAIPILDGREAVFKAWLQRDIELTEKEITQVEVLTDKLNRVENHEDFALFTDGYTRETVETAIALADTLPKRQQLKAWLNQVESIETSLRCPAITDYKVGEKVWFYSPATEQKWLKGRIESLINGMVRVTKGSISRLIENAQEIYPTYWKLKWDIHCLSDF